MILLQAAAQAVNAVASGSAVPVADPESAITFESYVHQAGLAAVTVWVIQVLKTSKFFPFLSANTGSLTRWLSTLSALAGALAIQFSITGDLAKGWDGNFHIPNAHALWDDIIRFAGSKIGQEAIYRLLYKEPVEVVAVDPVPMTRAGKPLPIGKHEALDH